MNKIKIGLVFENKDTAKEFVIKHAPYGETIKDNECEFIYETSILRFIYIKPFLNYKAHRLNFAFTNESIRDTEWFDRVISPVQIVGIGIIDQLI